jgi:hypothetical protein
MPDFMHGLTGDDGPALPHKAACRQLTIPAAVRTRRAAVLHTAVIADIHPATGIDTHAYAEVGDVLAVYYILRARVTVIINAGTFNAGRTTVAIIVAFLAVIA